MKLPVFTESPACTSGVHCQKCRDPKAEKWRASLQKAFTLPNDEVNFACPHGKEWSGEPPENNPLPLGNWAEKVIDKVTLGRGHKIADKAAKAMGKKDCGCSKRKAKLNAAGQRLVNAVRRNS